MLKKLSALPFVISFCLLTSCTPQPPDIFVFEPLTQRVATNPVNGHLELHPSPLCMEKIKEVECGHGVSVMTGREVFIGENPENMFDGLDADPVTKKIFKVKKPWSKLRPQSMIIPALESYAPLSVYMINACKKMNCNDQVDRFRVKLNSLNEIKNVDTQAKP